MGWISDIGGLFGSNETKKTQGQESVLENTNSARNAQQTETINLDPAAIKNLVAEALGSAEGLASIFGGEKNLGLYNTTQARQQAGDFSAQVVGEIAELMSEKVTSQKEKESEISAGSSSSSSVTTENADSVIKNALSGMIGTLSDSNYGLRPDKALDFFSDNWDSTNEENENVLPELADLDPTDLELEEEEEEV